MKHLRFYFIFKNVFVLIYFYCNDRLINIIKKEGSRLLFLQIKDVKSNSMDNLSNIYDTNI